ncbi:G patch domain-containing protein 4 isoform X2 [Xyrauchen texanus]|uniref:G patch domain-containing protein 4 isoform X2 n=1 Tax=Xyrauchen texanus TaxID=154827 RepID=UPI0022422052|nr:G patch domain-containing protein 4 isoform X2 [Xyrauchen texanus]
MAGSVQDKSATGLEFAEQQLLRHGWEKGKGLGRTESGISEAVKVKIKCGKGGIGHKEGEQFTFHWWDHVFNKASSSLVVETGKDGVLVKADNHNDVLISNKKPRKAQQAKSMLYGRFVKSATLLSGEEQLDKNSDSDDSSSSSEDEDQKLDLSSTTKLSDEDLLKACGGRTAHKGARHGLTLSAKLARLEQQEQEFMNKYGKKNQTSKTPQSKTVVSHPNPKGSPDITEEKKFKKSKRKEKPSVNDIHYGQTTRHILECNEIVDSIPKTNENSNGLPSINDDTMADTKPKKKKNRKKKNALPEEVNGDCSIAVNKMSTHTTERPQQQRAEEEALHQQMNESIPKKKKKRKSEIVAVAEKGVTADTDVISEDYTDSHDKQIQKNGFENKQTSESASKKKKRRNQASRDHHETSPSIDEENSTSFVTTTTQDTSTERLNIDTETKGLEKKPKKKNKRREVVENFEEYVPKKSKE